MRKSIMSMLVTCYRRLSPFYRNPIQVMPSAWLTECPSNAVLLNSHLVHDAISKLLRNEPHVGGCLREMDGEYVMHAVVEEISIDRGTLWVNIFPLRSHLSSMGIKLNGHHIASVDSRSVCAEDWAQLGVYQFFIDVSHRGFKCHATIKAIKDDRRYAVSYNPQDPVQSWRISLDGPAMESLGFNKHFH